jgi:hypothetical protein
MAESATCHAYFYGKCPISGVVMMLLGRIELAVMKTEGAYHG